VNDPLFLDPRLAEVYDSHTAWERRGTEFDFYMGLVMAADSVLDVGCGTGGLLRLARQAGHTGRLCGVDPAEPMLQQARRRPDIEWVLGEATAGGWDREFDLIVMTGHALQVILADRVIRATLAAVRSALTERGRFVFETRNPLVREWETWMPDDVLEFTAPDGGTMRKWHEILSVDGDIVTYTTTYTSTTWDEPITFQSSQRFYDAETVSSFLSSAGLAIEEQFGHWDRRPLTESSPEIITIATRR
jgi:ubiquinone/menaquinone biosynthesis C-methylase UbiE